MSFKEAILSLLVREEVPKEIIEQVSECDSGYTVVNTKDLLEISIENDVIYSRKK